MMPALRFLFTLSVSFTLAACLSTQAPTEDKPGEQGAQQISTEITKSPADTRAYRSITLSNGLQVMLVSDPSADQAAAALDVHVGSGHDPVDRQGLAHYLEHMLFLGTQKYPQAGEYQQYISEHGGSNNAYTVINHTNYFFNITPEYFEGALDRFAQFFIAPLFNEAYVKRERSIVHSEYTARRKDEGRRLWTARRVIYNPAHPSTQFSVGSNETLADRDNDPVRADLIDFYERYYHAPRMVLSVISKHDLDQLQSWVEEKFEAISDDGETYTPFEAPLVQADKLPIQLTLRPLKESRSATFSFPIESLYPYEKTKPGQYLSNLLGHEGEGSLLAVLKSRAWANGLSAGMGFSDDVQATFDITISLSALGMRHIDEIGSLLFSSIALIREQGIKKIYHDEIKQLAELDFQFQEKSSEGGLVQRLASQLHRYSAQEVLSAPYRFDAFEPAHVERILARLKPDNLQLIISDPTLEATQKTDWYNVAYQIGEIDAQWLSGWRQAVTVDALALPVANPFVPDQLEMLTQADSPADKPVKLREAPGIEVWHQSLLDFKQPKSELYFTLRSNAASNSAKQAVLTELYVKTVEEALNAYSYPALLAGLEYRIYRHSRGLSVRISGYSARQAQLLDKIVQQMQSIEIDPQRYELYVENIRRGLENSLKGRPSDLVIGGVYDVLLSSSWSTQEKLTALKTVKMADLPKHAKALLTAPDILVLSVGNVSREDSLQAGDVVSQLLLNGAAKEAVVRAKIRKLVAGEWALRHVPAQHDDAAIALVFQGETAAISELAATHLLGGLIRTPYYQALRTEAEIGYIVSAFAFNVLDAPALGFSVQSNSHSVNDIVAQTRQFLAAYAESFDAVPDATFEATKAGLIAQLSEEDKQLGDVASRYWAELDREAYDFDTRARLVAAIKAIDKTGLKTFIQQLVSDDKAVALLSYSFGDQADTIDLAGVPSVVQIRSLPTLRETTKRFF